MSIPILKTRFAPSPTGLMHLGNARTALFNALLAYHHKGIFLLRIEDTDVERSTSHYTEQIMEDLRWLGLTWQEGPLVKGPNPPYCQSERSEIYASYYQQLESKGQVYPCFCKPQELALSRKLQLSSGQAPRYTGTCAHLSEAEQAHKIAQGLQPTLRFRVPRGQIIEFKDFAKGIQRFSSDDLGDFIIRRADGTAAFFFSNALDDALMGVTHVLRGEDHLTNTPRQLLILQALGLTIPQYGHIPLILGNDGTPLSKRNGSQSIQELQSNGWLTEGIINYLARLGHSYAEEGYLSLQGLAEQFTIERLGHAPAHFDEQQLRHWQRLAISHATVERLWQWMGMGVSNVVPTNRRNEFVTAVRGNVFFPQDALQWARILFEEEMTIQDEAKALITQVDSSFFNHAVTALEASRGDFQGLVKQLKEATGKKGKLLFMPLRVALTGVIDGPEIAHLLPLLGVEKAKQRLLKWAQ